ncbi:unnamed protein product, partial [Toxocara canis]|uniref:BTB domain-containing protein n=1 Tax=Toxocara canis TaxID=6265 RepID=A0A183ULK3_TOXCA
MGMTALRRRKREGRLNTGKITEENGKRLENVGAEPKKEVPNDADDSAIFEWTPNEEQLLRHHAKVGQTLCDAMQNGWAIGYDIALKLSDNTVAMLHSEVARTHSEYFYRVLRDCPAPLMTDVSCFDADAVRQMIDFIYTGTVTISLRELPKLLMLAQAFQIGSLRHLLENFLAQKSTKSHILPHCLNIACGEYPNVSLRTKEIVLQEAIKNFKHLLASKQFEKLDIGAFECLMTRDDLPVGKEVDVFHLAAYYFFNSPKYNDPNRLLQIVRYDHIDDDGKLEITRLSNHYDDAYFSAALKQLLADSFWRTSMFGRSRYPTDQRPQRGDGFSFLPAFRETHKAHRGNVQHKDNESMKLDQLNVNQLPNKDNVEDVMERKRTMNEHKATETNKHIFGWDQKTPQQSQTMQQRQQKPLQPLTQTFESLQKKNELQQPKLNEQASKERTRMQMAIMQSESEQQSLQLQEIQRQAIQPHILQGNRQQIHNQQLKVLEPLHMGMVVETQQQSQQPTKGPHHRQDLTEPKNQTFQSTLRNLNTLHQLMHQLKRQKRQRAQRQHLPQMSESAMATRRQQQQPSSSSNQLESEKQAQQQSPANDRHRLTLSTPKLPQQLHLQTLPPGEADQLRIELQANDQSKLTQALRTALAMTRQNQHIISAQHEQQQRPSFAQQIQHLQQLPVVQAEMPSAKPVIQSQQQRQLPGPKQLNIRQQDTPPPQQGANRVQMLQLALAITRRNKAPNSAPQQTPNATSTGQQIRQLQPQLLGPKETDALPQDARQEKAEANRAHIVQSALAMTRRKQPNKFAPQQLSKKAAIRQHPHQLQQLPPVYIEMQPAQPIMLHHQQRQLPGSNVAANSQQPVRPVISPKGVEVQGDQANRAQMMQLPLDVTRQMQKPVSGHQQLAKEASNAQQIQQQKQRPDIQSGMPCAMPTMQPQQQPGLKPQAILQQDARPRQQELQKAEMVHQAIDMTRQMQK